MKEPIYARGRMRGDKRRSISWPAIVTSRSDNQRIYSAKHGGHKGGEIDVLPGNSHHAAYSTTRYFIYEANIKYRAAILHQCGARHIVYMREAERRVY